MKVLIVQPTHCGHSAEEPFKEPNYACNVNASKMNFAEMHPSPRRHWSKFHDDELQSIAYEGFSQKPAIS